MRFVCGSAERRLPAKPPRYGRARLCRANVRARLAQKTREIFVFPTSGAFVEAKLAFAAIEFVGVNTTPAITVGFVGHDCVQHFMIKNVLEEPERDEFLIEPGIDADNAVFFLDSTENEILFWTFLAFAAPNHFVTAKAVAEMTPV